MFVVVTWPDVKRFKDDFSNILSSRNTFLFPFCFSWAKIYWLTFICTSVLCAPSEMLCRLNEISEISFRFCCKSWYSEVPRGWRLKPSSCPQEDLRALQVCARGACGAISARAAGKDDDEAGVGPPETLHLWRRLGMRLWGVRLGPTWAQAWTGERRAAEQP